MREEDINFRERERLKRLAQRWVEKFENRTPHEQAMLYEVLSIVWWGSKGLGDVLASPSHASRKDQRGTAKDYPTA
jgi:hypothetical protein